MEQVENQTFQIILNDSSRGMSTTTFEIPLKSEPYTWSELQEKLSQLAMDNDLMVDFNNKDARYRNLSGTAKHGLLKDTIVPQNESGYIMLVAQKFSSGSSHHTEVKKRAVELAKKFDVKMNPVGKTTEFFEKFIDELTNMYVEDERGFTQIDVENDVKNIFDPTLSALATAYNSSSNNYINKLSQVIEDIDVRTKRIEKQNNASAAVLEEMASELEEKAKNLRKTAGTIRKSSDMSYEERVKHEEILSTLK